MCYCVVWASLGMCKHACITFLRLSEFYIFNNENIVEKMCTIVFKPQPLEKGGKN
jgi:hypothetical protein